MNKAFKNNMHDCDLCIVGGGLSGMCAAIAAARHGARVVVMQDRPLYGGNASSEIRMHICGADENGHKPHLTEGGILHEILLKNKDKHLSSEEIYDLVRVDCPEIGLAVYCGNVVR